MAATSTPVSLPPNYPRHLEAQARLADGRIVMLRPVVPSDAAALASEIEQADAETLHNRFLRQTVNVDERMLNYLTVLDYDRRLALAAFAEDGAGAAIARYEAKPHSAAAEIAVAVKPGWRGVGLASVLLSRLEQAARRRGIERLEAVFLAENEAALALMEKLGFGVPVYEIGVGTVSKQLAAGD